MIDGRVFADVRPSVDRMTHGGVPSSQLTLPPQSLIYAPMNPSHSIALRTTTTTIRIGGPPEVHAR